MLGWLYRWADGVRQRARRKQWTADKALGRDGEDAAHRFLQRHGLTIVARNYKTRGGSAEVDLVAWDAGTLVFVEVKTRSTGEFGSPDRAIDRDKQRKITFAAMDYLRRCDKPPRIRFDIVTVIFGGNEPVKHFRDAFWPE